MTFWMSHGGPEVIFASRQTVFDGTTAIRGGIPLCLPEFGAGINGDTIPKHGWAHIAPWQLLTIISIDGGDVHALLSVSRDRLTALYEVEIDQALCLGLGLCNEDSEPHTMEAAVHTYLSAHGATASRISGLAGAPCNDNLAHSPQETHHVREGGVTIHSPVDRIYDSAEPIIVIDPEHQRTIGIDKRNALSTVVWSPWSTHSAPLPDMADDEFPAMVCIESGVVREHAPTTAPGTNWSMQVTVSIENTAV